MSPPADAGGAAATQSILRDRTYIAAASVAVVVALGFGLVIPVLPLFARSFGVGLFAVTLVVSVFAGVRLVANIYTGGIADRIGSGPAIGWGAGIVALSSLATAAAPTFWALVVLRGLGGFGSALFMNALMSLIVRIVPPDQRGRAIGVLQGAFLFGIAIGPGVGGALAGPLGLRWPFVIYAVFCAAAGVVALRWLPHDGAGAQAGHVEVASGADDEPVAVAPRRQGMAGMVRTTRELAADPAFVAALVMMLASRWSAAGVRFSLIPVFAREEVGASPAAIGFALTLAAVTHLALTYPAGRISDTFGRRALGAPAYLAFAVVAGALVWVTSVPAFLFLMALYGIGTGLTAVTPPAVVADVVPPERAGVAVGVLNTAGDLGSVFGPIVSGALADVAGYGWGFGAAAAMLVVGAGFAARMRETLPGRVAPQPGR